MVAEAAGGVWIPVGCSDGGGEWWQRLRVACGHQSGVVMGAANGGRGCGWRVDTSRYLLSRLLRPICLHAR